MAKPSDEERARLGEATHRVVVLQDHHVGCGVGCDIHGGEMCVQHLVVVVIRQALGGLEKTQYP